jgi:hypothetical protein
LGENLNRSEVSRQPACRAFIPPASSSPNATASRLARYCGFAKPVPPHAGQVVTWVSPSRGRFGNSPSGLSSHDICPPPWQIGQLRFSSSAIQRYVSFSCKEDLALQVQSFCDRNTTLGEFLEACVLPLHNCPNASSKDTTRIKGAVTMRQSLESQIPDTTPYTEWLAIVCSVIMAALCCAVLFSNGVLT